MINKFKIYPHYKETSNKFYDVIIFSTHDSMYEYYKNTGGYQNCDFDAICRDLIIYTGNIEINKIGEILIPINECNTETLIHECGHAAFQFMRKINEDNMWLIDKENNTWNGEEFYCVILENFCKQIIENINQEVN